MARKPAAKAAPAKPERDPITLPEAASFTSDVRTLAVNVTILLAIVLVVPVIVTQFWRNQVVIEPITVPGAMLATGLTPEVAAGRLWDGLEAVTEAAGTAKRSVVSIPESAKVDFAIPDSGLSIDSLVYYVRQFFNSYETRVSGEFRCADADCAPEGQSLRIRVVSNSVDLIDLPARGNESEDSYFRDAAAEVMARLDPFTALAAVAITDSTRGKVLARRLIRSKHPDAKWANNLLGNLLRDEGDLAGALEEYEAALALDPNFPQALANKGMTLLAQKDLAGAKAAFDKVLARDKTDIFALSGYADLMIEEGKGDEAVAYLLRAADIRPLPPTFLSRAADVRLAQGRQADAEALFNQALEIDPGDTYALVMIAKMYFDSGRKEDAERVYRAAAEFAPDSAEAQAEHATMLLMVKKRDEALARAQKAVELMPKVAKYHAIAAKAYVDLQRFDEALAELGEAERLEPGVLDNLISLGDVHRGKGDYPAAIEAYSRYLELAPPDDPMRTIAEAYITVLGGTPPTPAAQSDAAPSTQP